MMAKKVFMHVVSCIERGIYGANLAGVVLGSRLGQEIITQAFGGYKMTWFPFSQVCCRLKRQMGLMGSLCGPVREIEQYQ